MRAFSWGEGPAQLHFLAPQDGPVQASWGLVSSADDTVTTERDRFPEQPDHAISAPRAMIEIIAAGSGRALTNTRIDRGAVSEQLRYVSHEVTEAQSAATTTGVGNPAGAQTLTITQRDAGGTVEARTTFTRWVDTLAVRAATTLVNTGTEPLVLQAVSSVALSGITPALGPLNTTDLWSARSDWCGESRWSARPIMAQDGLADINSAAHGQASRSQIECTSTSTFSSGTHVPVAALTNSTTGAALVWEMEIAGPWHWELNAQSEDADWLTLVLSGPTDLHHGWATVLHPGESFTSIPVSLAFSRTSLDGAMSQLTAHRRHSHLPATADSLKPLVFNDYMNALMGDPTTENEIPLIDAAAAAGAEYYCIDCGWYDDTDDWWPSIGTWTPSTVRFGKEGLVGLLQYIRDKGMEPGLWIEPEAVGVNSPAAASLPEECFMHRMGQRITEHQRHLLDLRSQATRDHLSSVFDRLINELGARYFKWDYNVTPGSGPDTNASSPGEGLLDHVRAHITWVEELRAAHPDVIFEACSSGAQRMDQSILQRFDLQSTSDERDYRRYPTIAASAPMSMAPEQAGNWAYPHGGMTLEQIAFTMVTGLSGRLYMSGHLNTLSAPQLALVTEAAEAYRNIIDHQRVAVPAWPLGLPSWESPVVALATIDPTTHDTVVFLWNRSPLTVSIDLPLDLPTGTRVTVETLYPRSLPEWGVSWLPASSTLQVNVRDLGESARILRVRPSL